MLVPITRKGIRIRCLQLPRCLLIFALLFLQTGLNAQGASVTAVVDSQFTPVPLCEGSECTLEAYVDGLADALRKRDHLAGISIAVVRPDRLLLTKGYGMSALPKRPVDAEASLFRVGSLSKLFTYISAMQLVEQGRLDLDKPVNDYLAPELKIPTDGFTGIIKVRDLFQHTAGFEDLALGQLFVKAPTPVLTLDSYLAKYRPRRVREPGIEAVYSNYSVALLGSLVAKVSGQSFEDYVAEHIFDPLAMKHSSFKEPIELATDPRQMSGALAAELAKGMRYKSGGFVEQPIEQIAQIAPAGGLSSTAADMGRFARALLNNGSLQSVAILKPETLSAMQTRCFRNGSSSDKPAKDMANLGVQPMCSGFLTQDFGKFRGFGHGGATLNFHTAFVTIPELSLGVFVSINTDNGREPAQQIARQIVSYLAPAALAAAPTPILLSANQQAQPLGSYLTNRRAFFGFQGLVTSLRGISVNAAGKAWPPGSLLIESGGNTEVYLPIAPLIYQHHESGATVKFMQNTGNTVTGFASSSGISTAVKLNAWTHPLLLVGVLNFALLIALLSWFSAYAGLGSDRRPGLLAVKALSLFNALLVIAAMASLALAAADLSGPDALYSYPNRAVWVFMILLPALALLAVVRLLLLKRVLTSQWRLLAKLGYCLSALTFALLAVLCWRWNLLTLAI